MCTHAHIHTHTTKQTIKGIPKCGYRYVFHQVKICNTYISQMINAIVDVLHPVTWIDKHIIWQSFLIPRAFPHKANATVLLLSIILFNQVVWNCRSYIPVSGICLIGSNILFTGKKHTQNIN